MNNATTSTAHTKLNSEVFTLLDIQGHQRSASRLSDKAILENPANCIRDLHLYCSNCDYDKYNCDYDKNINEGRFVVEHIAKSTNLRSLKFCNPVSGDATFYSACLKAAFSNPNLTTIDIELVLCQNFPHSILKILGNNSQSNKILNVIVNNNQRLWKKLEPTDMPEVKEVAHALASANVSSLGLRDLRSIALANNIIKAFANSKLPRLKSIEIPSTFIGNYLSTLCCSNSCSSLKELDFSFPLKMTESGAEQLGLALGRLPSITKLTFRCFDNIGLRRSSRSVNLSSQGWRKFGAGVMQSTTLECVGIYCDMPLQEFDYFNGVKTITTFELDAPALDARALLMGNQSMKHLTYGIERLDPSIQTVAEALQQNSSLQQFETVAWWEVWEEDSVDWAPFFDVFTPAPGNLSVINDLSIYFYDYLDWVSPLCRTLASPGCHLENLSLKYESSYSFLFSRDDLLLPLQSAIDHNDSLQSIDLKLQLCRWGNRDDGTREITSGDIALFTATLAAKPMKEIRLKLTSCNVSTIEELKGIHDNIVRALDNNHAIVSGSFEISGNLRVCTAETQEKIFCNELRKIFFRNRIETRARELNDNTLPLSCLTHALSFIEANCPTDGSSVLERARAEILYVFLKNGPRTIRHNSTNRNLEESKRRPSIGKALIEVRSWFKKGK